ncbi:hypothetical protein DH86_00002247, partial [Scytalidium sp. 3C]
DVSVRQDVLPSPIPALHLSGITLTASSVGVSVGIFEAVKRLPHTARDLRRLDGGFAAASFQESGRHLYAPSRSKRSRERQFNHGFKHVSVKDPDSTCFDLLGSLPDVIISHRARLEALSSEIQPICTTGSHRDAYKFLASTASEWDSENNTAVFPLEIGSQYTSILCYSRRRYTE